MIHGPRRASEALGGIPGWLTYFSYVSITNGVDRVLDETTAYAVELIKREICNFLIEGRLAVKDRYLKVLEVCEKWLPLERYKECIEGQVSE